MKVLEVNEGKVIKELITYAKVAIDYQFSTENAYKDGTIYLRESGTDIKDISIKTGYPDYYESDMEFVNKLRKYFDIETMTLLELVKREYGDIKNAYTLAKSIVSGGIVNKMVVFTKFDMNARPIGMPLLVDNYKPTSITIFKKDEKVAYIDGEGELIPITPILPDGTFLIEPKPIKYNSNDYIESFFINSLVYTTELPIELIKTALTLSDYIYIFLNISNIIMKIRRKEK